MSMSALFQSTPPVKAATPYAMATCGNVRISIHAAREGGDGYRPQNPDGSQISIHAAREGGDGTLSLYEKEDEISIHAAREGGDTVS